MQPRRNTSSNSSCFNLKSFYDDLSKVESSLNKRPSQKALEMKIGTPKISQFSKELKKYRPIEKKRLDLQCNSRKEEVPGKDKMFCKYLGKNIAPVTSNILDNSSLETPHYSRLYEVFENGLESKVRSGNNSENIYKRRPKYSESFQSTLQMPLKDEKESKSTVSPIVENLLTQLTRKNEIYLKVKNAIQQQDLLSSEQIIEKLDIMRQEAGVMSKIINQFKKISKIEMSSNAELLAFLREGKSRRSSQIKY